MKLYGGKTSGKHINNGASGLEHTAKPNNSKPEDKKTSGGKKKSGKAKRAFAITFGVLALLLASGAIIWKLLVVPPPVTPDSVKESPPVTTKNPAQQTPKPQNTEEPPEEDPNGRKSGVWTFLIAGMDQESANTDTLMIGMLDTVGGTVDVMSIPRDTLVNVSWSVKKANSIYAFGGGMEGLIEGVQDLLGYKVDCYALVNMVAFKKLVDAIGGVYYDVPVNMYYDDPTQDLHIGISKGYQWLSGEDALKVVRFRNGNNGSGYANGDIGRIDTQQSFLKSVAQQMLTLGNIPNLNKFAAIYEEDVDTNLTAGNIIWFATEFLKMDSENIRFHTLPGDYQCSVRGGSYVSINIDEWLETVNEYINPFKKTITAEHLNILTKDASGNLYSTTGVIAGGEGSFYDYRAAAAAEQNETPAAAGDENRGDDDAPDTQDTSGGDDSEDSELPPEIT